MESLTIAIVTPIALDINPNASSTNTCAPAASPGSGPVPVPPIIATPAAPPTSSLIFPTTPLAASSLASSPASFLALFLLVPTKVNPKLEDKYKCKASDLWRGLLEKYKHIICQGSQTAFDVPILEATVSETGEESVLVGLRRVLKTVPGRSHASRRRMGHGMVFSP